MLYRHQYIFNHPALPLSALHPSVEKLLGPLVHSHNYISTRNNQYLLYRNSARNTHPLSTNLASRMARLSSKDILAAIYLVLVSNYFHIIN